MQFSELVSIGPESMNGRLLLKKPLGRAVKVATQGYHIVTDEDLEVNSVLRCWLAMGLAFASSRALGRSDDEWRSEPYQRGPRKQIHMQELRPRGAGDSWYMPLG